VSAAITFSPLSEEIKPGILLIQRKTGSGKDFEFAEEARK
jgi:hypothetical protein